jgi:AAA+ superfamily predicted ATPase
MNPDLLFHLKSLTRCIYYVTEEEDRFLAKLAGVLKKYEDHTFVYNAIFGMVPIKQLIRSWTTRSVPENRDTQNIHDAIAKIYTDDPQNGQHFYIITDPERWLPDPQVQRRFLNIFHQLHNDDRTIKVLIFVGNRLVIPPKLQRYIEVIHDKGLTEEEISQLIEEVAQKLQIKPPKDVTRVFRGLTSYEADAAIAQSIIKTKRDASPKRIDPRVIAEFKRRQLAKTDLLDYVDVSPFTFDVVGGNDQFKAWADKTKAAWTEEGQSFGLRPPKGVLAVGVWGCGKSLSIKSMGNAWKLPVVQLEMGRLRSSAVGESEANVYRAINLIESVAPCLVWIDEAEKSLSGGHSSSMSDAGTTSRVIGILSNWLQETTSQVCLAMTANSLDTLPVEFVNRMDERFFFDLPSEEERVEILKIHLLKRGQNPEDFQLAELAELAVNMVGREIEQAIGAALIESFHAGCEGLSPELLAKELQSKPRIFKTMVDELKKVLDWVGYDPDIGDGIRARFASNRRSETFKNFRGSE